MELETTRFGKTTINQDKIVSLDKGLIGFEQETQFVLIPSEKNRALAWMQSVSTPSLAFVVANPFDFYANYEFDIDNEDVEDLQITAPEDVIVLSILTVPSDPKNISANLIAPIIINKQNRKGKQIILKSNKYQTKHYILHDLQKLAEKAKDKPEGEAVA